MNTPHETRACPSDIKCWGGGHVRAGLSYNILLNKLASYLFLLRDFRLRLP